MKSWWLVIALLLSLGINAGLLAAVAVRRTGAERDATDAAAGPPAQPGPSGPQAPGANADPGVRLARLADRLGLEGEMRRRFLEIQWRFFEQTARLRMQQGEVHREMRRALVRGEPDRARVERLLQESARLYMGLEKALAESVIATRALLPPAQEREYLQLLGRLRREGARGLDPRLRDPERPWLDRPRPWQDRPRDRFPRRDRRPDGGAAGSLPYAPHRR